jgi:hypothetical protein
VDVEISVQDVPARFGWPLGPSSLNIIAWKNPDSTKDEKDTDPPQDACIAEVTIWPRASGKPKLRISSPDGTFVTCVIETRENGSFSMQTVDNRTVDDRTYAIRRAWRIARTLGTYTLGFTVLALTGALGVSRYRTADVPSSEVVAVQPVADPSASQTPENPPAESVPTTPAPIVRIDCFFLDPERTQDAQGKVAVNCSGELFQATSKYLGEGRFEFTDLVSP